MRQQTRPLSEPAEKVVSGRRARAAGELQRSRSGIAGVLSRPRTNVTRVTNQPRAFALPPYLKPARWNLPNSAPDRPPA